MPKTPEQNDAADRLNRTLIETIHSMLTNAKLSHVLWSEALFSAVNLRNEV